MAHNDFYNHQRTLQSDMQGLRMSAMEYIDQVIHGGIEDAEESNGIGKGNNRYRIYAATKLGHANAATSITSSKNPVIRILTGSFIESANKAETDGPLAAAQMALFFKLVGVECCVVTDRFCADVCEAALASVECAASLEIVEGDNQERVTEDRRMQWKRQGVTHVIAIERPGPASDHKPHNMNGEVITHYYPLHQLFTRDEFKLIGIIDRGNELGSGALSLSVIRNDIYKGDEIACDLDADYLITSRVSNWAGAGLIAALGVVGPKRSWIMNAKRVLSPDIVEKILVTMVERAGAVDGITRTSEISVDALRLARHKAEVGKLRGILSWYHTSLLAQDKATCVRRIGNSSNGKRASLLKSPFPVPKFA